MLLSIFQKEAPLHDGAVLIKEGRINQVACYLPLSSDEGLPKAWGTRHRAALGLSQRCDGWVVVVSEERGEVSLARNGEMHHVENEEALKDLVLQAVQPFHPQTASWKKRIRFFFLHRWRLKLGVLASVSLVWLILAGQQNFEKTFQVPVEPKNLPKDMSIVEPANPKIQLTVRGLRKDASTMNERNVMAELDLSLAALGRTVFFVTRGHLILPNDRIQVLKIEPSRLAFVFQKKERVK